MAEDYATLTNPASVAANRAGALSPEQRAELERGKRSSVVGVLVLLVVGVGFVAPLLIGLGVFGRDAASQVNPVCAAPCALVSVGMLVLAARIPASNRRYNGLLRDDLAAGAVEQAEGEVTFGLRGYVARLEPHATRTTPIIGPLERPFPPRPVPLPPGRYRFYYLPRTRMLLSAEPLTSAQVPQEFSVFAPAPVAVDPLAGLPGYAPPAHPFAIPELSASAPLQGVNLVALQAALAEGTPFTLDELAANRCGHLSGRQSRRLLGHRLFLGLFGAAFVVTGVGMLGLQTAISTFDWINLLIGGVCAAVGLIPVVVALRGIADAVAGRVVSVVGVVRGEANSGSESTTYFFRTGSMRFQVSWGAYRALVSGMAYRIHYTPLSRTLVSIEPLGQQGQHPW